MIRYHNGITRPFACSAIAQPGWPALADARTWTTFWKSYAREPDSVATPVVTPPWRAVSQLVLVNAGSYPGAALQTGNTSCKGNVAFCNSRPERVGEWEESNPCQTTTTFPMQCYCSSALERTSQAIGKP